jgi:hypothetical protein
LIADLLQTLGIGALLEAVGQSFEDDAFVLELAFGPLVPIETDLERVGSVGADLDEPLAELGIVEIEIVVFDEDRLAGVLELNETPVRGWAFS